MFGSYVRNLAFNGILTVQTLMSETKIGLPAVLLASVFLLRWVSTECLENFVRTRNGMFLRKIKEQYLMCFQGLLKLPE